MGGECSTAYIYMYCTHTVHVVHVLYMYMPVRNVLYSYEVVSAFERSTHLLVQALMLYKPESVYF